MKKLIILLALASPLLLTSFRRDDFGPYATVYIVFAGASTDFNTLDSTAHEISDVTGIAYENYLVHDSQRGMIEPDSSDDDVYAGYYFPRRDMNEERISIEMTDFYASGGGAVEPSQRMCIVTGIFASKADAYTQLGEVKKAVPDAYVKKFRLYVGCMH